MQSEDDFSLSGVPITALCFDEKAQFLVSGDKNGMVRILIDLLRYNLQVLYNLIYLPI